MCILFVAHSHDPSSKYRLIVASNRDEVFFRPSRSAHFWEEEDDHSHVLAGEDLTEGAHNGTWLGITTDGKFAVLTNFSDRNADAAQSATSAKEARSAGAGSSPSTPAEELRPNIVSPIAVLFALICAAFLSRVSYSPLLTVLTTCVVFVTSQGVASRYFPLHKKSQSRESTKPPPKIISRGGLARDFLCAPKGTLTAAEYMEALRKRAGSYNGFNLICGDRNDLLYFTNRTEEPRVESLSDSVHGVSNSHLGEYPKVRRGVKRFRKLVAGEMSLNDSKQESPVHHAHSCAEHNKHPHSSGDVDVCSSSDGVAVAHIDNEHELIDSLMDLLSDKSGTKEDEKLVLKDVICVPHHVIRENSLGNGLPDTDVWYGTRTHTVVLMKPDGEITFVEKDYDIDKEEWETKVFRIDPSKL